MSQSIKIYYEDVDPPMEALFGRPSKWDGLRKAIIDMPISVWRRFTVPAGMSESARNSAVMFVRSNYPDLSYTTVVDRSKEESDGFAFLYLKLEKNKKHE